MKPRSCVPSRLFGPALLIGVLAAACAGPTLRDTNIDNRANARANVLAPEVRPPIQAVQAEEPSAAKIDELVRLLSSRQPLARLRADAQLRATGAKGVLAASALAPDKLYGERALRFVSAADVASLSPEGQAQVRRQVLAGLKSEAPAIRAAAADVFQRHGPGEQQEEFLRAILDDERAVRWAVVRRYSEEPMELAPAQVQWLASQLGESRLAAAVRADVHALLMRQHQSRSEGARPPGYDAWTEPRDQQQEVLAWRAWAAAVK